MNGEDYSSDTSDEDYIPEEAKDVSEDDDNDEEPCNELDETTEDDKLKGKKRPRKRKRKEISKKNPLLASIKEPESKEKEENEEATVDDKQKEESLWADFLADVDEKPQEPKAKSKTSWASLLDSKKKNTSSSSSSSTELSNRETPKPVTKPSQNSDFSVSRVEEEVDADSAEAKEAAQKSESKSTTNKSQSLVKNINLIVFVSTGIKRPLGLSSVVSLLDSKKKKLTTLEKTKIDWLNYKTSEGIQEEMQNHLKSKDGYLEKKEFLERADLRQFEIERDMRMSKRNNR
ncbi:Craniofacial development protein 1 [Armadillidium nasatum]|uniref:Craniofacial development protein 1 n=1 Tax=Armadillidium nasatum TaxID=96803 RepID=A0A5N5T769_9CRUS|nr:Craniofacial development protein 1 [Armadillidium nasatum]